MTDVAQHYVFPSHLSLAYRFFAGKLPDVLVARDEPPAGWDKNTPIVLIKDGGGGRIHHLQLADRRVTFEVRAPDGEAAEALATRVFELMRAWPFAAAPVYLPGPLPLPQYFPLDEPRLPAYIWTVTVTVKSVQLSQ